MREFYEKYIATHQSIADECLNTGEMKKYLYHLGELKNYKAMLDRVQ